MARLLIKSLPEKLHERLKRRAAGNHRSLTKETLAIWEAALAGETNRPSLAELDRRRVRGAKPLTDEILLASKQGNCRYRRGFTKVELVGVIVVVALVVGLLLTAYLGRRRPDGHRPARVRAELAVIATGLEMFRNDFNRYPESRVRRDPITDYPAGTETNKLSGAHWLARAMAGHDLLGIDEDGKSLQDGATFSTTAAELEPSRRRGPYVDTEKMYLVRDNDRRFKTGGDFEPTGRPVILGSYGFPILYYKANAGAPAAFSTHGTGGHSPAADSEQTGIYNQRDNHLITGSETRSGWDFAGTGRTNPVHCLGRFGSIDPEHVTDKPRDCPGQTFTGLLYSEQATQQRGTITPHNADAFILISAGEDGIYGTSDDIANFPIGQ